MAAWREASFEISDNDPFEAETGHGRNMPAKARA
jgi:hypothetical protein